MSGYCDCACRDCFEIAINDEDEPALCNDCEAAGCDIEGNSECSCEPEPEETDWNCSMCFGPVEPMGKLGEKQHGRCRGCGVTQSRDT